MSRPRVFRDPIHGLINVDPADKFVLELINAPEFQRLRRVRQLGVSHLTYPGAEHTRFNHSLGVFQVAQRMMEGLLKLYGEGSAMGGRIVEHRRLVKAAALLHDTGHAAFSHLMERAFEGSADHEQRSQDLIAGAHSSIPVILKRHGLNAGTVADIVGKRFPHRFLQDIVSSSLDADRMDYLLRDAHFTGVRYGVYDLEWLMNCVCLGTLKPEQEDQGEAVLRLCLDRKRGLYSAEQLMMARQHMSVQVYFHKSTRRWEAHLLCLFREAARLAKVEKLPKGTLPAVADYFAKEGAVDDTVFLEVDEPAVIGCLGLWAGSTQAQHRLLAQLSKAYLRREKVFQMMELPPSVVKAAEWRKLLKEQPARWQNHWELDDISFSAYKMPKGGERQEDPEGYFQKIAANAVLLSDGGAEDTAVPVQEVSPIFRTLGAEQPRFLRLYFLPEMTDVVQKIDKKLRNC